MIKKFKTFEEARRDLWVMNPDDAYFDRVSEFYNLAEFLLNRNITRGILKFRTFEDAQEHRNNSRVKNRTKYF